MEDTYEQAYQLRALAMRVAALEDNVAFIERWCEEQQDTLDRAFGSVAYDYEIEDTEPAPPTLLRVVDLRDNEDGDVADGDTIVAVIGTDQDRALQIVRAQLNRLRSRLAASLAPADGNVSARPAGRTAP
jgi:hypothetical protein